MKLFVEEAKKHKSAEEFVKAQKPFYHGTTSKFTKFQPIETFRRDVDTGGTIKVKPSAVFLAEDKNVAKFFARDKVKIDQRLKGIKTSKSIVMEVYVEPKKTLDLTITPEVYEKFPNWMNQMGLNPITSQIFEKFGYEPVDFVDIHIALDDKSVVQGLKDMGYDSVLLREQSGAETLAVLNPKDVLTKQPLTAIYKRATPKVEKPSPFQRSPYTCSPFISKENSP